MSESIPVLVIGSYQYQSAYEDLLRDAKLTGADNRNDATILNIIPADTADAPYLFTVDDVGGIDNIIFLDKSAMNKEKAEAYTRIVTGLPIL